MIARSSRRSSARKISSVISRVIAVESLETRRLFSLPAGWTNEDIGSPGLAGSSSYTAPTFTVSGSGSDIFGSSDQLQFCNTTATGNGTLIAEINSLTNTTNNFAKGGVMLRDSTGAGAIEVSLSATYKKGLAFLWRSSTNGSTSEIDVGGIGTPSSSNPIWLELSNSSNSVTASYSLNGTSYTTVATESIPFTQNPYLAGLAVNSHDNAALSTATFTAVSTAFSGSLAAPTGLSATAASTTQVNLNWTASSGATGYYIYRGTSAGGESSTALNSSPVTTTTYSDTTASPGTTYYYTVKATNGSTNSAASNEASATTLTAAPTSLSATAVNSTTVNLSWTGATGATGYFIYRGTSAGGESTTALNSTPDTNTTYSDTTGSPSTTYYYVVKAADAGGNSAASNEASATTFASSGPSAPTGLSATALRFDAASLTWNAVSGATGYNIYRGTSSGGESGTALNASPITATSYTDATLNGGTAYYYTVKAVNSSGSSGASNEVSATTPTATQIIAIDSGGSASGSFVADTDFSGGSTYSNSDTINTSKAFNPASATVYDSERYGNITYTIPNLTVGDTYTVRLHFAEIYHNGAGQRTFNVSINGTQVLSNFDIYADAGGKDIADIKEFNATANSSGQIVIAYTTVIDNAKSSGIEIWHQNTASAPLAPTGLGATTVSSSQINLSWTASSGATGYYIYRGTTAGGESTTALNSSAVTTTSYSDTGLSSSTTYYYIVKAVNGSGSSPASNEAHATTSASSGVPAIPTAPNNLIALANSATSINVTWNNTSSASGIQVDRSPNGSTWTTIANLSGTATSYSDTGLTVGNTYYYQVRAVDSAGFTSYNTPASSATVLATASTAPAAPSGLTVAQYSAFENNISWTNNSSTQEGVSIERSVDGANFTPVATVGSTISSFTDAGLTPNTAYFYRIRSYNSAGYSSYYASTNPIWLQLVKNGSNFTANVSTDGVHYTQYGSTQTLNFTNSTFLAGVYATSHENTTLTSAMFLGLTTTSTAGSYSDSDIGSPGIPGAAVQVGANGWYVQGSGNGVYSAPDQCNYESVPVTGNQTLTVEVDSMSNTGTNFAEAGIMLRDSNASNAAYASLFIEPAPGNKGAAFDWRANAGGGSSSYGVNTNQGPTGNYAFTTAATNTVVGTASYFSGTSNDAINSIDTEPNGTIVQGGSSSGNNYGQTPTVLNGGTSGLITLLNSTGTAVTGVTRIGTTVTQVQVNQSNGNILAVGDFGAVLLNPTGTTILRTYTGFNGIAYRCAIGTDGTVAILSSPQGGSNPTGSQITVYNSAGTITGQNTFTNTSWSNRDIALDPVSQQVYLVGDYNGYISQGQVGPVQVAFLFAFNYSMVSTWTDYNANTANLSSLAADTYGFHVALGRDGYLYFEGESAGGNSQFQQNPQNISNSANNYTSDIWNTASNTKSNQILYVTKLNPATGAQVIGEFALTRLSNGMGNSCFGRGGITADANGKVFAEGTAAFQIQNRDSNTLNGTEIAPYSGDLYVLELSSDFTTRKLWTSFGSGSTNGSGIAIDGTNVVLASTVNASTTAGYYGALFSTSNAIQYTPDHALSSTNTAGWMAVIAEK